MEWDTVAAERGEMMSTVVSDQAPSSGFLLYAEGIRGIDSNLLYSTDVNVYLCSAGFIEVHQLRDSIE